MTDAPPVRRRVLGAALRRFREQAGCTLDDAARILDCGRSKISRIETGQRGIRATELQELLAEYGVDEPRRDALLTLADQSRQDGWWQSSGHVRDGAHPASAGLGGAGTTIGTYEAQLLPGLLQTEGLRAGYRRGQPGPREPRRARPVRPGPPRPAARAHP